MPSSRPFVDSGTGTLDTGQIFAEAVPLAKLVGVVVAVALVPFAFVLAVGGHSPLGLLFTFVAQFVLAVGSGVVLVYVVARGVALAGDQ